MAVVIDVRGGKDFETLSGEIERLGGEKCRILFLDASDEVLFNRYRFTRRRHPLIDEANGSLEGAVALERKRLFFLREKADYLIDTSLLSGAQLKERLAAMFLGDVSKALSVHCMAQKLEGMPRHASKHAAGVVITEKPVMEYVPLSKNDESIVTQFTMTTLEELGLLKMDFLGLRTLTVISDAERMWMKSWRKFRQKPGWKPAAAFWVMFSAEGLPPCVTAWSPARWDIMRLSCCSTAKVTGLSA